MRLVRTVAGVIGVTLLIVAILVTAGLILYSVTLGLLALWVEAAY